MKRYVKLYCAFMLQWFKVLLDDRINFFIGALSTVFVQAAGLLTIWVVLSQTPDLGGWAFHEVMLVYGLLTLARALNQLFATGLMDFGQSFMRTGELDRFLVRPINPLFHVLASRLNHEGVGYLVIGALLVAKSVSAAGIAWTPLKLAYLLMSVLSGGVILMGLNLIMAVTAIWLRDALPLMWSYRNAEDFAMYPLSIFGRSISALFTWVLPVGFASFYPASYLLGREVGALAWGGPVGAALVGLVGYSFWKFGLRHYTSTGS